MASLKHLHFFAPRPDTSQSSASSQGEGEGESGTTTMKKMKTGVEEMDERTQIINNLHEQMLVNQKQTAEIHELNKTIKGLEESQQYLNRQLV